MAENHILVIYSVDGKVFEGEVEISTIKIANGYIGALHARQPIVSYLQPSYFYFKDSNGKKVEGVLSDGLYYMDGEKLTIMSSRVLFFNDIKDLSWLKQQQKIVIDQIDANKENKLLVDYLTSKKVFLENVLKNYNKTN